MKSLRRGVKQLGAFWNNEGVNMKKAVIIIVSFLMILLFSVPSFAYYMSPEDIYGEADKGYDEGYADGFEESDGRVVYKTREVSAKEYIADHETRFRELYITFFLVLGICVVPILVFRYIIKKDFFADCDATMITVVYNLLACGVITYIMYRIDYLVPCISLVVLWGIICRKILAN